MGYFTISTGEFTGFLNHQHVCYVLDLPPTHTEEMKVEVRIPEPTKILCVFWWESWNPGAIRGG